MVIKMKIYMVFARLVAGIMLIILWGLTDSPLSGVAYILALTVLSALRYRAKPYKWLMLAEIAVCVGYALFWLPSLLGLWLPVLGFLEDKWREKERELLNKDYDDRARRFMLEESRKSAEERLRSTAHIAEITERARIAQNIHDHAGHEISGALLALQTALKLYSAGDERAGELLTQTMKRLESASENLRETVHNLKPSRTEGLSGASAFEELCGSFAFCKADFTATGDVSVIEYSELLIANLKEALTNVAKHSNATKVNVRLDVNADYIRLIVSDNGSGKFRESRNDNGGFNRGLGLSGMKERVRAVGGTLTVSSENGFKIVCIIPRKERQVLK